jgi:hypothetical protein
LAHVFIAYLVVTHHQSGTQVGKLEGGGGGEALQAAEFVRRRLLAILTPIQAAIHQLPINARIDESAPSSGGNFAAAFAGNGRETLAIAFVAHLVVARHDGGTDIRNPKTGGAGIAMQPAEVVGSRLLTILAPIQATVYSPLLK